ncbi:MAG: hypothetical protein CSA66_03175 [Proteobacteria bacterium]|nr:MAG: hypothetical protein CSA66_03175 [Pseudomonadota bacterium]
MSSATAVIAVSVGMLPAFVVWLLVSGDARLEAAWLAPALPLVAVNVFANVLFLRAVTVSPLSLTIPLLAFTPVFAALLGLLFGDVPAPLQWLGIVTVVAGALALTAPEAEGRSLTGLAKAAWAQPGGRLMVVVAALWALAVVLDRESLAYASIPMHAILQVSGVAVVLALVMAARGRAGDLRAMRGAKVLVVASGLAATVALGAQLLALRQAPAGDVEAIKRAIGLAMAVAVGRLSFGEAIDAWRIAAVALMGAGATAVVLGSGAGG